MSLSSSTVLGSHTEAAPRSKWLSESVTGFSFSTALARLAALIVYGNGEVAGITFLTCLGFFFSRLLLFFCPFATSASYGFRNLSGTDCIAVSTSPSWSAF